MLVTIYPKITETVTGKDIELDKVLQFIKSGRWEEKVNTLRKEKSENGKSDTYKALKKDLPYFTTSGTFSKRSEDGLIDHSGFIAVDIDNLQDLQKIKEQVKKDRYTYAVFTSCSGNGLCVIVKIDPENHYESFSNIAIYYTQTHQTEIDHLADISRPRFISYDPDLYINPDSQLFDLEYEQKEEIHYEAFTTHHNTDESLKKAVELVERNHTYTDGGKHNYMVDLARVSNKLGIDLSALQGFVRACYPDWYQNPTNAIEHIYRSKKADHGAFQKTTYSQKTETTYTVKESQDDFLKKLKSLEADWNNPAKKPVPVVSVKGNIISTAGNITLYSGHSKVGKSGAITAIKAGSMPLTGLKIDTLGFDVVPNTEGKLFLSIDTEQSWYNFDKNFRDSVNRSGQSSAPEWFKSVWLKNEPTKKLIEYTWKALEIYDKEFGGVYHIVIDGIGDYVLSANDDAESRTIVTEFTQMAEKYKCPLSTMLHLNPGSEKQRGHLGTFLQHKSESVLTITRQSDVSQIHFQLLRNGGDAPDILFKYDKSKGYHVFQGYGDTRGHDNGDKNIEVLTEMMRSVLSINPLSLKDLEKAICESELVPPSRARAFIRAARQYGIIDQRGSEFSLSEKSYVPF